MNQTPGLGGETWRRRLMDGLKAQINSLLR